MLIRYVCCYIVKKIYTGNKINEVKKLIKPKGYNVTLFPNKYLKILYKPKKISYINSRRLDIIDT